MTLDNNATINDINDAGYDTSGLGEDLTVETAVPAHKPDILTMKIHPLAEVYPQMSENEYDNLLMDVQKTGRVLDPIVIFEGQILDGRHRRQTIADSWDAGKDIAFETRLFIEEMEGDPAAYVVSKNSMRRHMSQGQKAVVALQFFDQFTAEVKKAKKKSKLTEEQLGASAERAAALCGVSEKYIRTAAEVRIHDAKLIEDVRAGGLSLYQATKTIKKELKEQIENNKAAGKTAKPLATAYALAWERRITAWVPFDNTDDMYRIRIKEDTEDNGQVIYRVECGYSSGLTDDITGEMEYDDDTVNVFGRFDITGKLAEAQRKSYDSCVKHCKEYNPTATVASLDTPDEL